MMKYGRGSHLIKQVLIDLTPLLDVIFIILIVILSFQNKYEEDAEAKILEAEDHMAAAESENRALSDHVATFENLDEYMNIVTVHADYVPSNRKYRTIRVLINADVKEIDLNPSNTEKAWEECKDYIVNHALLDAEKPVILSIENTSMLYRDELQIEALYSEIGSNYPNIYLKNELAYEN